ACPGPAVQGLVSSVISLSLQRNVARPLTGAVSRAAEPSRSYLQQRFEILPEYPVFFVLRKRLEPLDPAAGPGIPGHERPVAAENDAVDSDAVDQETQGLLARGDGVVVEAPFVDARRLRDVARFGTPMPHAVEPSHDEACRAAAVRDAGAQVRT